MLSRAGLEAEAFKDITQVCHAIEAGGGAGAVLVAEEAISPEALRCLSEVLARQPPWSDLLTVVFATNVDRRTSTAHMPHVLDVLGNVTFVERPVRVATLVTVMNHWPPSSWAQGASFARRA